MLPDDITEAHKMIEDLRKEREARMEEERQAALEKEQAETLGKAVPAMQALEGGRRG